MTTRILLLLLGLAATVPVVLASPADDNSSLTPVNATTRFALADAAPCLAIGVTGTTEDSVLLRDGEYREENGTIVTQVPQAQGRPTAWVQKSDYWIEPVTPPPGLGEPLVVPFDDMRVAEAAGEVTLQESDSPAKPLTVNEDMEVPNGATITTAATGSAAILVGGHTSVRIAPNSCVLFRYDTAPIIPRLAVSVLSGAVFCKIGQLSNGKCADVGVQGPVGEVAAMGSCDFMVKVDPVSLHVCLVQGRLLLGDNLPLAVGNLSWYPPDLQADDSTGARLGHFPAPRTDADRARDDAQTLSFALHQAADLNINIKELTKPTAPPLSSDDQRYLAQVPRVTWYARAQAVNP
jgi:hypothetical protein